jgi:VIT1/CCC1 family predicted Fe2+/Mn2+ transporter
VLIATLAADAPVVALVAMVPLSALYSLIGAILPVVVYYLLRAEKEGIGINANAKVFD